jgi:hypothetical protein
MNNHKLLANGYSPRGFWKNGDGATPLTPHLTHQPHNKFDGTKLTTMLNLSFNSRFKTRA